MVRRWWRIAERALPVRTKDSQVGLGREVESVTISTMSPLRSSVRSEAGSLLMLTATVWSPMPVWIEYAKSIGVAPRGSAMIFDLGVNTYTESGNRSTLTCSRNSAESPVCCWMSSSDCSHAWVRCCRSDRFDSPFLYSQCAATPDSAVRCISWVRFWYSDGVSYGPIQVV